MFKALISQHHTEPIVQKIAYDLVLSSNIECAAPNLNYLVERLDDTSESCANPYKYKKNLGCDGEHPENILTQVFA